MAFGIPSIMTTLAPYHIISYGTLLGTSLFQTFINTKICFLELPKSAFTTLQKRLFPIYFRCQALLLVLTVLTFPPHGPTSLFKVKSNWIPLMVAGITSLANLLVYGPRSRQAMIDRTHQGEPSQHVPTTIPLFISNTEKKHAMRNALGMSMNRVQTCLL